MLLSHYTSRKGLEGIARDKSIWATKFSELNDKREVEYGHIEITKRSIAATFAKLDTVFKRLNPGKPIDYAEAERRLLAHFRETFVGPKASEPLYFTSFAIAKTEDQEKRGILTLWDRYTQLRGYCLQYDSGEVNRALDREVAKYDYPLLGLDEVQYGIDEQSEEYREIMWQMSELLLDELRAAMPLLPFKPDYAKRWNFNVFAARMMHYVARHKDPFFEDEREARIIAIPAKYDPSARTDKGLVRKPVQKMDNGRSYIAIAEALPPGLEPRRIIAGPRASGNLGDVLKLFDRQPEVLLAEFPI